MIFRKPLMYLGNLFHKHKQAAEYEIWEKAIARTICPTSIEEIVVKNPYDKSVIDGYLVLNRTIYLKCLVIGRSRDLVEGYPRDLSELALKRLYDIALNDRWFFLDSNTVMPIDTGKAQSLHNEAVLCNLSNQNESAKGNTLNTSDMKLEFDLQDLAASYKEMHDKSSKMYGSAYIILVGSTTMEGLDEGIGSVSAILDSEGILHELALYRMLEAYKTALPFPFVANYAKTEIFADHAADLCSISNPSYENDSTGLIFGKNSKTGEDIIKDLGAMIAEHMLIVGPTGSGKSFSLLCLLMRAYDLLNKRIIYTTCKPESKDGTNFKAVADYYGESAELIQIGPGTNSNINPLQILYDRDLVRGDVWGHIKIYDSHKQLLIKFFRVFFGSEFSSNMESYLDETLNEVYKKAGIYRDNPDTWNNPFPFMRDLREIWLRDSLDSSKGTKKQTAEALTNKSYHFDTEGSLNYINSPTNINISKDFIILDISGVPDIIQDATNVLVTGLLGSRFAPDLEKETILAVDEGSVYLQNPELCNFLLKAITKGRGLGLTLWLSTQQPTDLKKAGLSSEFQTNMMLSLILSAGIGQDSISYVQDYFSLTPDSCETILTTNERGKGILIIDKTQIPIHIEPTDHEKEIIKGQYIKPDEKEKRGRIKSELLKLADENGVIFSDWYSGDVRELVNLGYESHSQVSAIGAGKVKVFCKKELVKEDGKIINQSKDHYFTVMQLAGHLIMNGAENVTVNHSEDVDVSCNFGGVSVAFEYERAANYKSNEDYFDKFQRAKKQYQEVLFICNSSNKKQINASINEENVVVRGNQVTEWVEEIRADKGGAEPESKESTC